MLGYTNKKILFYGYGNPGRQDDGLGPTCAERLREYAEKNNLANISTDSNYQLNVEDAVALDGMDEVFFIDASKEGIASFAITTLGIGENASFTTHSASPSYVLGLCKELYGHVPIAYLVHIRGYEWEFREGLSPWASRNLEQAYEYIVKKYVHVG